MPALLLVSAWVNGWPMRLSTTSDPVQVRPGTWLAELQSAGPVSLKEGDEIAVCPSQAWGGQDAQRLVRVVLYRKAPRAATASRAAPSGWRAIARSGCGW